MIKKVNPESDTFEVIFNKYQSNFEYLESLINRSSIRKYHERFLLKDTGSFITLSNQYRMNSNSIELYIDGVRQHPETFVEINPRTIQLLTGIHSEQIADIYYTEHFRLDGSSRNLVNSPLVSYTSEYHCNSSRPFKKAPNPPIHYGLGQVVRIIIQYDDNSLQGSVSLNLPKLKNISIKETESIDNISYTSNSIIIDLTIDKGYKDFDVNLNDKDPVDLISDISISYPTNKEVKFTITYLSKLIST